MISRDEILFLSLVNSNVCDESVKRTKAAARTEQEHDCEKAGLSPSAGFGALALSPREM